VRQGLSLELGIEVFDSKATAEHLPLLEVGGSAPVVQKFMIQWLTLTRIERVRRFALRELSTSLSSAMSVTFATVTGGSMEGMKESSITTSPSTLFPAQMVV